MQRARRWTRAAGSGVAFAALVTTLVALIYLVLTWRVPLGRPAPASSSRAGAAGPAGRP